MNTLGIIGAMDEEIAYIKEKIEVVAVKKMLGLDFYVGRSFGKSIVVVKSGIGKVNAAICAQVLADHFAVDYIINIGVAGAISKELNIGDIVISSDAVEHDMDTTAFGDPLGKIPRMDESYFKGDKRLIEAAYEIGKEIEGINIFIGRIASGDQFISDSETKNKIHTVFNAMCTEMEGAAIAHTCYLNNLPFIIIRSISDKADGTASVSYSEFVKTAAKNSGILVSKLIEKI